MNASYKKFSTSYFLRITICLLCLNVCNAQDSVLVYEIPFSLETRLLVFKGQMNGIDANFAFDTGAAEGVANKNHEKNNRVEKITANQKIIDGNGIRISLQSGNTKELRIGGFSFKNVRSTFTDMQYLTCMDLYLLGADVIRQLNWEIDFEKMVLKVSKNRFVTTENMVTVPINYKFNTTRTEFSINNVTYKNILIDMGFNGQLTMPSEIKSIKKILQNKREQQLVTDNITTAFALAGTPKPSLNETIIVDSLLINGYTFYKIPASCQASTDFKIGLNFFSTLTDKLIINNSDKKFYLQMKSQPVFKNSFAASVILKDGQLIIISLLVNDANTNLPLEINEVIKSVNGKTASDFVSDCDYINWYYKTNREIDIIEKNNGKKVIIKKVPIKA